MDEELYKLLDEAEKRGYKEDELKELIVWYKNGQKPAAFETPKPRSRYLDYIQEEEPSALDYASHVAGNINRVVYESPGQIAKAVGIATNWGGNKIAEGINLMGGDIQPENINDNIFYKAGEKYQQGLETVNDEIGGFNDPESELYNVEGAPGFFLNDVPQGVGSVMSIMMTGGGSLVPKLGLEAAAAYGGKQALLQGTKEAATKVGKLMASRGGIMGSVQMGVPEYERAIAAGVDEDTAFRVFINNYLLGATEVLPISDILSKVNKFTGNKLVKTLKSGGIGAFEEAVQEGLQQLQSNNIAAGTYDPDRNPTDGLIRAMLAGGVVGGGLGTIAGGGSRKNTPENNIKAPEGDLTPVQKQEQKVEDTKVKAANKLALDEIEKAKKLASANVIENDVLDETKNTGTENEIVDELQSIATLAKQLKIEKEQEKVFKEQDKLNKEQEKIDLKAQEESAKEPTKKQTTAKEGKKEVKAETKPKEKVVEPKEEPKAKVEKRRGRVRKVAKAPTKVKTPEGTINLETGEVSQPTKGKKLAVEPKPRVSGKQLEIELTDEDYTGERNENLPVKPIKKPAPNFEKVEAEKQKLNTMFINRNKLAKPAQRLERLKGMLNKTIPSTKFPDVHTELIEKIQKEVDKLESRKIEKTEVAKKVKEKKESKPKVEKPKVSEEQKEAINKEVEETQKRVEALEEEKKAIVKKYDSVRDKTGRTLVPAKEQAKWDPADIEKVRSLNVRLDEEKIKLRKSNLTPEQDADYKRLVEEEKLSEQDAISLSSPEETTDLGVYEEDGVPEDTRTKWSNIKEVSQDEFISKLKSDKSPVFAKAIDSMVEVIQKALSGGNIKVLYGKPNRAVLGQAVRDQGKFYIVLSGEEKKHIDTKTHELVHIFEFAINQLEGGKDQNKVTLTESFNKINKLHKNLVKDLSFTFDNINKKKKSKQELNLAEKIVDTLMPKGMDTYALSTPREMVAEAMSNPNVAAVLAHLQPSFQEGGKPVKTNYLKAIYDATVELVNKAIDFLKTKGINLKKIQGFDSSYLNEILSIFDDVLSNTDENGGFKVKDLEDIASAAFESPEMSADMATKNSNSSKLSKKLFEQAYKDKIKTGKPLLEYLKKIEDELEIDIPNSIKVGVVRRLRNRYQLEEKLKTIDKTINDALKLNREYSADEFNKNKTTIDEEIDYETYGRILTEVNVDKLDWAGKQVYVSAVEAFVANDKKTMANKKAKVQGMVAKERVDIILGNNGVGFQEFSQKLLGFDLANFANLPTFIGYITKYSRESGTKLMKYFHDILGNAYSETQQRTNAVISKLNTIALENKLSEDNFKVINAYGQLLSNNPQKPQTLEEKYKTYREMLMFRLEATKRGQIEDSKPKDVEKEIESLDIIYNNLINNKQGISTGELAYYNALREELESIKASVKANAEIAHNEVFIEIENYLPTVALGALPTRLISESGEKQATTSGQSGANRVESLDDAMHPEKNWNPMAIGQSGFEVARKGGKGVYYDTNIHTVAARYFNSVLFDIYAAQQVQVMNKMFKGENMVRMESEFGIDNTAKLYNYMLEAIKSVKNKPTRYSSFTKGMLKVKNMYQTARIGTLGQLFNQLFAMVPAVYAQYGVKNTNTAVKIILDSTSNEDINSRLKELVSYTSQLKIRDFFFEKFESAEDVAKAGVGGKLQQLATKTERGMTASMVWSDKAAATINFLAAFTQAGGDINNKNTWTTERISQAELKTTQLQNVSSQLFMPPALRQKNETSALILGSQFAFKSFALNATLNTWLAGSEAISGNKEAGALVAGHLTSALAYEFFNSINRFAYGAAAVGVVSLATGEPPEWPEIKTITEFKTRAINAFYNFFFSGLPNLADSVLKFAIDCGYIVVEGEKQDKIYIPQNSYEMLAKGSLGVYSDIAISTALDPIKLGLDARQGKKITEERQDKVFGKLFVQSLLLNPYLPYRGDAAKLVNTYLSDQRSEDKKKSGTRKRRIKPKKLKKIN